MTEMSPALQFSTLERARALLGNQVEREARLATSIPVLEKRNQSCTAAFGRIRMTAASRFVTRHNGIAGGAASPP
jgi:hypothetical protein